MSSDENASTFQSYVNSATGAAQSALGSLTGSTPDKAEGEARRTSAQEQDANSHTVGKLGNVNVGPSGTVTKDDPRRTEGSWNQTVGAAKEAVGGLVGAEGLKRAGQQQNAEGKQQEAQGQVSDLGSGVADRVTGALGGVKAGLTGDEVERERYKEQHDVGKTQQRSVEADLQKQAEADR